MYLPTSARTHKLVPSFKTEGEGLNALRQYDPKNEAEAIPVELHAEGLALFYPWFSDRRGQIGLGWGKVMYRTLTAFLIMEYVTRGDWNFGLRSSGFKEVWKQRVADKEYVRDYLFGSHAKGDVWLDIWPSGEKRGRKAGKRRRIPPFPRLANGDRSDKTTVDAFSKRWGGRASSEVLGMGWLNPDYRRGAPGQHWLGGVVPDLWDRVPAGIPKHYRKVKKVINLGADSWYVRRKMSQRNRKWFGLWLPRTGWEIPPEGFDELWQLPLRTKEKRRPRKLDKGDREVFLTHLGLAREIDWQRWVYNGWHLFDGALEAVRGSVDPWVRERLGTHPHSAAWGGPGSPFIDPRGRVGGAGSYIDWVEMEAPWVHVRFTREYKRDLVLQFNKSKKEWLDMAQGNDKLTKPVRKRIAPFIEEARQMTEREKHTHILGLGDGVGTFCKLIGEMRYGNEEAYLAAFPDKSSNPTTVRACASRLMKEDRVALGVAIYVTSRTEVVKEAAQVKFMDLYSRTMEVFQASMDTANHKVALDAIKFLAEVSGHLDKNGKKGASGVNVNILQSNNGSSTPSASSLSFQSDESNTLLTPLMIENNTSSPSVLDSRESRAKARLKQLINVMDNRERDMDWVNTNSLILEDEIIDQEDEE